MRKLYTVFHDAPSRHYYCHYLRLAGLVYVSEAPHIGGVFSWFFEMFFGVQGKSKNFRRCEMYKHLMVALFSVATFLMTACAPTLNDVADQCQKEVLAPGQDVQVGTFRYPCPQPTPTKTPGFNAYLTAYVRALCENNESWFGDETKHWLAQNIGGSDDEWVPDMASRTWIYKPRIGGFPIGSSRFKYPGFGVLRLESQDGNLAVVTNVRDPALWKVFTAATFRC